MNINDLINKAKLIENDITNLHEDETPKVTTPDRLLLYSNKRLDHYISLQKTWSLVVLIVYVIFIISQIGFVVWVLSLVSQKIIQFSDNTLTIILISWTSEVLAIPYLISRYIFPNLHSEL